MCFSTSSPTCWKAHRDKLARQSRQHQRSRNFNARSHPKHKSSNHGKLYRVSLRLYNRKRKFNQTPEPKGQKAKPEKGTQLRFVVQMHDASRLHYDLRLEWDGVFKSWAVPKGPSLNPLDQRLAVFVEDHPLEYGNFEGIIPPDNYGAGTVMVWDSGTYIERGSANRKQSEAAMLENFKKGHLTFVLKGYKLNGEFALVKLKKDESDKGWLLLKKRDEHSTFKRSEIPHQNSVKTGRSIKEIAEQSRTDGSVWLSKSKNKVPKSVKRVSKPSAVTKQSAVKTQPAATTKRALAIRAPSAAWNTTQSPMPRKNRPMIATPNLEPLHGKSWIFEVEPDGLRALAEVEGLRILLYSKSGLPFEKKFPQIVNELKTLRASAVLDGKILQSGSRAEYQIFDLLYLNGEDLRNRPLRERKELLAQTLSEQYKFLRCVLEASPTDLRSGKVVAKNLESSYRAGTTSDWQIVETASQTEPILKRKSKHRAPTAHAASGLPQISIDEPRLTHLDKVFFPEDGITKGDVIEYYRSISSFILPYLKDRPESLNRQPNGIAAQGFYQKDMTGHIPRWLKTTRIYSESNDKSIDYTMVQDERSLLYIANLGCIEIHTWFSRVGKLDHPDFLVIDLDPDTNSFDHVIEVAHEVHKILDKIGAANFCKTSGATGLHIGVPTGARYDFDAVREFAEAVCKVICKQFPATTSLERSPARRRGKIYLDFMQNRRGQTLAAPFCIRPRPGAPVSMPLPWKALKKGVKPSDFNIYNALSHAQGLDAAWRGVLGKGIDLKRCRKKLQKFFDVVVPQGK